MYSGVHRPPGALKEYQYNARAGRCWALFLGGHHMPMFHVQGLEVLSLDETRQEQLSA
jgi:hypothetical protein